MQMKELVPGGIKQMNSVLADIKSYCINNLLKAASVKPNCIYFEFAKISVPYAQYKTIYLSKQRMRNRVSKMLFAIGLLDTEDLR